MTIQQISQQLGVSRQAVYKRLRRAGAQVDKLTERNSDGKRILTDQGVNIIRKLFTKKVVDCTPQVDKVNKAEELQQSVNQLSNKVEELTKALEEAHSECDRLKGLVQSQSATIQAQAVTAAAQASIIKDMQEVQKLSADNQDHGAHGVRGALAAALQRLSAKIGGKDNGH